MRVVAARTGVMLSSALPKKTNPAPHLQMRLIPLRFGGAAYKEVKLMTYNVENYFAPGGRNAAKSPQSVKALAEVIRRANPDILALQEIEGQNVLDSLNQTELGNAYKVLSSPGSNDPRGIKVGYLYKNDIQLESWTSHLSVKCGQKACLLRDALLAKFKFTTDSGAEDSLYVITVHLKSMRGGEAKTTPTRIQEAKEVNTIVANLLKTNPTARVAVVGDFNTKGHNQYGQRVLKAVGAVGSNPMLIEVFDGQQTVPPTHPGLKNPEKLDYIFVTPNLLQDKIKASVTGGFKAWPWSVASDHLPVSVTVKAQASAGILPAGTPVPFAASQRKPLKIYA